MERIHPIKTANTMAHFVLDRLTGGGWSALPQGPQKPVVRPVRLVQPETPEDIVA